MYVARYNREEKRCYRSGAGGQIRWEAGQTGEGDRVDRLAGLGTGRGKETGTGRRVRAGTARGGSERHWAGGGRGWSGVPGESAVQVQHWESPEQEVMGHRSGPGPSTLEVTAAA